MLIQFSYKPHDQKDYSRVSFVLSNRIKGGRNYNEYKIENKNHLISQLNVVVSDYDGFINDLFVIYKHKIEILIKKDNFRDFGDFDFSVIYYHNNKVYEHKIENNIHTIVDEDGYTISGNKNKELKVLLKKITPGMFFTQQSIPFYKSDIKYISDYFKGEWDDYNAERTNYYGLIGIYKCVKNLKKGSLLFISDFFTGESPYVTFKAFEVLSDMLDMNKDVQVIICNPWLITFPFIRRDQIVFGEMKNDISNLSCYSLSDFKKGPCKNELMNYINGRYGSVGFHENFCYNFKTYELVNEKRKLQ